jgi:hypothetical protein
MGHEIHLRATERGCRFKVPALKSDALCIAVYLQSLRLACHIFYMRDNDEISVAAGKSVTFFRFMCVYRKSLRPCVGSL